ncbi:MAG TPA: DUF2326 domain-containing protein [Candidatus Cryosericum sp.]
MIYSISSTLPTFKSLVLASGLNLIVVDMGPNATQKQTRNRAGKSSIMEIVHFLLGAKCPPGSIFRSQALANFSFSMCLDVGSAVVKVERSGAEHNKVYVETDARGWPADLGEQFSGRRELVSNDTWKSVLGRVVFGLQDDRQRDKYTPTYRSLINYYARRDSQRAYLDPFRNSFKQDLWDMQVAISFFLGLDWTIAHDLQILRDQDSETKMLKRSSTAGVMASIVGRVADLRTALAGQENECVAKRARLATLQVLPDYREREQQANEMAERLKSIRGKRMAAKRFQTQLNEALTEENPPAAGDLQNLYDTAGVQLPEAIVRSFQEARTFHESVIANRRSYLQQQLQETANNIAKMNVEETGLQSELDDAMRILTAGRAFEQYSALQEDLSRLEGKTTVLRERFKLAETLEARSIESRANRARLQMRLQQELSDRYDKIGEASVVFADISKHLYETSAGSFRVAASTNGLDPKIDIQGASSKGITQVKILCFDFTLMKIANPRPGFLLHDSHIFDGVDSRQTAMALQLADQLTHDWGFQYVATINSNDIPDELTADFVDAHRVGVELSDDPESGGLFGITF